MFWVEPWIYTLIQHLAFNHTVDVLGVNDRITACAAREIRSIVSALFQGCSDDWALSDKVWNLSSCAGC